MKKVTVIGCCFAAAACGDRPDAWDAPTGQPTAIAMQSGVALVDDGAHRAMLLEPLAGQELARRPFPIGHGVVHAEASVDRARLFVLSIGDLPRKNDADERPSLTVLERKTGAPAVTLHRFPLATPVSGIALDPLGKWAALYAGGDARAAFVENPNEIILVDLETNGAPVSRTIRSFGGRPQRLTFTPVLQLPGGPRRLLIVETEQDVTLLDLDHANDTPPRPEITIRLTNGDTSRALTPGGVVVDDGDPAKNDDARVGLRLVNDPNVVTLTLAPPSPQEPSGPNDFKPRINLTDVGGPATDIAFVRTDGGLRLAALVPSTSSAVLVEPDTSVTTVVQLSEPFGRLSLITDVVGTAAPGTDVALLYPADGGRQTRGVAFWALGKTAGQPYRSVEVLSISTPVSRVLSVPSPHPELKVLESSGNAFYVLDLVRRTASPLDTVGAATIELSQDGTRLWAWQRGGMNLAAITLDTIHPVPLTLDRPVDGVFDVARDDGGKSLVVVHERGAVGATVFDARTPDTADARGFYALLLEGL